ncbi:magnesium transporter CorA family protein [Ligilactobacillus sp.]|uniref:magnesium transporter CorA family protein n=1 Tax=Ligilactobacillus sp. TaxID=2767921 RepID=UPI002FDF33AC
MPVKKLKCRKACFLLVELMCLGYFLLVTAEIFKGMLHVPELIAAFSNETLACLVFVTALRSLKKNGHFECFTVSVLMIALTMVSFFLQLFLAKVTLEKLAFYFVCGAFALYYYFGEHDEHEKSFWKNIKYLEDPVVEIENAFEVRKDAPLKYRIIDKKIVKCGKNDNPEIVIMTPEEYQESNASERVKLWLSKLNGEKYTTVDIIGDEIFGTMALLNRNNLLGKGIFVRYHLSEKRLIFIDKSGIMASCLADYVESQNVKSHNLAQVFLNCIYHLTYRDDVFFNDYERKLDLLEDNMADNVMEIPRDFEEYIFRIKKEQRHLMRFYKQLTELVTNIAESGVDYLDEINLTDMQMVANRLSRLNLEAQSMYEYATQIIDTYQAKINVRQNKVMQILTIVTTIFMPLTLITGWYGMNFNIPETTWKYGYLIAIISSIIIITVEIILFKKEKWM